MTLDDINKVIMAVLNINIKFYDSDNEKINDYLNEYGDLLMASTEGSCISVEFLGNHLWDSDNDEREFNEEVNDWEPIYPFLLKKVKERIEIIGSIKIEYWI